MKATSSPQAIHRYISTILISMMLSLSVHTVYSKEQNNTNLTLLDTLNQKHQVSEYIGKGKWLVLNFWGTRCPPCREEVPELVMFHDEHHEDNAMVVGIAIDFPSYGYAKKDEVTRFMDDYLIEFPVLLSDARATQKLGLGPLEGLPTTYLYTPNGKIAAMQVGGVTQKMLEDFISDYETSHKSMPLNTKKP